LNDIDIDIHHPYLPRYLIYSILTHFTLLYDALDEFLPGPLTTGHCF